VRGSNFDGAGTCDVDAVARRVLLVASERRACIRETIFASGRHVPFDSLPRKAARTAISEGRLSPGLLQKMPAAAAVRAGPEGRDFGARICYTSGQLSRVWRMYREIVALSPRTWPALSRSKYGFFNRHGFVPHAGQSVELHLRALHDSGAARRYSQCVCVCVRVFL